MERPDPLVAIGDDPLLEAATFALAVWLRGVPTGDVPVTTLGLIDTAIGGKGGVDLAGVGRNLLGAIHQPTATILDVALVADETPEDRRAALAEAVKYGLIGDDALLALPRVARRVRWHAPIAPRIGAAGARRAVCAGQASAGHRR